MFMGIVILLMGTISAATESESWNDGDDIKYAEINDQVIASTEKDNFNYYAIQKYNGTVDIDEAYTGYFLATSKNKKTKIKSVTLEIYDGNTGEIYTKTFKGNSKSQILIKLCTNKTVNVFQDGPISYNTLAKITFQKTTSNSNSNKAITKVSKISATMKETGIPINILLLVFCSVLAVLIERKQN